MLPPQVKKLLQEAFDYAKKLESEIEQLKSEIARLKNVPEKPTIKDNGDKNQDALSTENNRGGSNKGNRKKKKTHIKIHEEIVIRPKNLPPGSKLKDIKEYTVQDIEIKNKNTRYKIERWLTLSSERVIVENVFAYIKKFKIISQRYRNRRKRFGLRFNLICGIFNYEWNE